MDIELLKTSRDFSIEYGTFLGIIWLITFGAFVKGMTDMNLLVLIFAMMMMVITLFAPFYFAWRYKQHLKPGKQVSISMAWMFAAFMFLYASLLTGAGEFLYFSFLDKGQLIETFQQVLNAPETAAQHKAIGTIDMLEQGKQQLQIIAELTPMEIAANLFANNIFVSLILSFPVALVAHRPSHDIGSLLDKLDKQKNDSK